MAQGLMLVSSSLFAMVRHARGQGSAASRSRSGPRQGLLINDYTPTLMQDRPAFHNNIYNDGSYVSGQVLNYSDNARIGYSAQPIAQESLIETAISGKCHISLLQEASCEGSLEVFLGGRNPGQPDLLYNECLNVAAANSTVTNADRLRIENAYYCIADCRWHEGARTSMGPSCRITIPPATASVQSPPPSQALLKPMCGKVSWRVANMYIHCKLARHPETCKNILK